MHVHVHDAASFTLVATEGDVLHRSIPLVGYKIIGDNIDKNVRSRYSNICMYSLILNNNRYIREGNQTLSLHCYNSYAVRDRTDISGYSDEIPNLRNTPLLSIPVHSVLPSITDEKSLLHNFTLLVGRLLVDHMKYFSENYGDVVTRHIMHDYYEEMSQKSETVSNYITRNM